MFLRFDASVIKWIRWGIRQMELLMNVRVQTLFKALVVLCTVALFLYGMGFSIYFSLLQMPYFLVTHMIAIVFFVSKLLRLRPVVTNWFAFAPSGTLALGRKRGRFILCITLLAVVSCFLAGLAAFREVFLFLSLWFGGLVMLFIVLIAIEYILCTEPVPMEEILRRQKRKKR